MESSLTIAEEKDANPFYLLGIEPWVLRSLSPNMIKELLGDFKRHILKYHHPDKYQDANERKKHEHYFQLACSTIDQLLGDDYFFRQSIDGLHQKNVQALYAKQLKAKEEFISSLREDIKGLNSSVLEKEALLAEREKILRKMNAVNPLIAKDSFPISNFSFNLDYINFSGVHGYVDHEFNKLCSQGLSPLELELRGRELLDYHLKKYYSKNKQSGKNLIFNTDVNDGRFKAVYNLSKSIQKTTDFEILGGLPFNSIRDYFSFYNLQNKPNSMFESVLGVNFSFQNEDNDKNVKLERIRPFLSNFITPLTFALVKADRCFHGSDYDSYELIVPVKISKVKYRRNQPR